jgi:hypothetical protein
MRLFRGMLLLILPACSVLASAPPARADVVSFYDSTWNHGSGPQSGWTGGQTSGTTTVLGDVTVTVTSQSFGTATPVSGMHMSEVDDGSSFTGFGLVQDPSTANNGGTLSNYTRLDFAFSEAVLLDSYTITDIDRIMPFLGFVDISGYWDVVAVEGFVNGLGAVGSGIMPDYALSSNTLLQEVDLYGLAAVRAGSGGNGNEDPRNSATFDFGQTHITGFSIYYWNNGPATDASSRQIIGVANGAFEVVQTPEPASLAVCLLGILLLGGARRLDQRGVRTHSTRR